MNKTILMSIKTEYTDKIFAKTKLWEFRKAIPKLKDGEKLKVVVYSSKVKKAIIGEFTAGKILKCSFDELMIKTGEKTEEEIKWFKDYYQDRTDCYAIEILNPTLYSKEVTLKTLKNNIEHFAAPQNFIYITKDSKLNILIRGE